MKLPGIDLFAAWFRPDKGRQSILLWVLSHAVIIAALVGLVVLTAARPLGRPVIALHAGGLVAAYLALSLLLVPAARRSPLVLMANLIIGTLLLFGAAYLAFRLALRPAQPGLLIGGGLLSMVAAPLPYLSRRARIASVSGLLIAGADGSLLRARAPLPASGSTRSATSSPKAFSIQHSAKPQPCSCFKSAVLSITNRVFQNGWAIHEPSSLCRCMPMRSAWMGIFFSMRGAMAQFWWGPESLSALAQGA